MTDRDARSTVASVLAIGCAALAVVLLASLHVLSPEYSPAWRMISEYANGHYPWVLSLMFVAYGLSILSLTYAIRNLPCIRRSPPKAALRPTAVRSRRVPTSSTGQASA